MPGPSVSHNATYCVFIKFGTLLVVAAVIVVEGFIAIDGVTVEVDRRALLGSMEFILYLFIKRFCDAA